MSLTGAVMGMAGILLLAVAVVFTARSITTPLHALARATASIARGDFEVELPPARTRDEVGTLTDVFMVMKGSLKEYIRKLTKTTAAKERRMT